MPLFARYIGIDYSGARGPSDALKGLRVYAATRDSAPAEVLPPCGTRKYWSRRALAEWLIASLRDGIPTIVGVSHGFSFPVAYFEKYGLAREWPAFLEDFQRHWPTDDEHVQVDFIRDGASGTAGLRSGNSRWRRVTERCAGAARSVFHFDVQGSIAKATHSGLPWLLRLRRELAGDLHFWPFDGWEVAPGKSAIVEVHPRLWSRGYDSEDRDGDQQDAYSICRRMLEADRDGTLAEWLSPNLSASDLEAARVEGWILGVGNRLPPTTLRAVVSKPQSAAGGAPQRREPRSGDIPTAALLRVVGPRSGARWSRHAAGSFVHQFLITLGDTEPVVWRRIQVPGHYTFWDLHVAIQDAMGWEDRHLHEFVVVDPREERLERIGIPTDSLVGERPRTAGWKVRVDEYVANAMPPMLYLYDFGDEWNHIVSYEGTLLAQSSVDYPRCVSGQRRCPPEDCGGASGYRELLAVLSNPRHPSYRERLQWLGGSYEAASFQPASIRFDDPEERWRHSMSRDQ